MPAHAVELELAFGESQELGEPVLALVDAGFGLLGDGADAAGAVVGAVADAGGADAGAGGGFAEVVDGTLWNRMVKSWRRKRDRGLRGRDVYIPRR